MSIIADGLLIATCLTAAVYCFVLARRLKRFSSTEEGIGQQILQLTRTLEETRAALKEAQAGAKAETEALAREVVQARKLAAQLRSMSDNPPAAPASPRRAEKRTEPTKAGAAGLVAAAAVPLDETPVADAPEPQEEDDEIDPAALDVNSILAASAGEQQLGFLPDPDGMDEDEEAAEDGADSEEPRDIDEGAVPDNAEATLDAPGDEEQGNLLKVERMAL